MDFHHHLSTSIKLEQQTAYPWDGRIVITIRETMEKEEAIFLRIPGWCKSSVTRVNGRISQAHMQRNGYIGFRGKWKVGDKIEMLLDMPVILLESNPLVEETRNQGEYMSFNGTIFALKNRFLHKATALEAA